MPLLFSLTIEGPMMVPNRLALPIIFQENFFEGGSLTLLHISSTQNLADICTKSLSFPRLNHLFACIFGIKLRVVLKLQPSL